VIAVDTNVLVYAHREDSTWHAPALAALTGLAEGRSAWAPSLVPLAENETYWAALQECLAAGRVVGPQVHDARVAALCLAHGVRELWTHDRDFGRFSTLAIRNPLV
jgi:predicted nucleic acid-binding protein